MLWETLTKTECEICSAFSTCTQKQSTEDIFYVLPHQLHLLIICLFWIWCQTRKTGKVKTLVEVKTSKLWRMWRSFRDVVFCILVSFKEWKQNHFWPYVCQSRYGDWCPRDSRDRQRKRRGRCCKTSLSSLECSSSSSSLLSSSVTHRAQHHRAGFFFTKMEEKVVKMFNKLGETQGETPGEGSKNPEFAGGEKRRHPRISFL